MLSSVTPVGASRRTQRASFLVPRTFCIREQSLPLDVFTWSMGQGDGGVLEHSRPFPQTTLSAMFKCSGYPPSH